MALLLSGGRVQAGGKTYDQGAYYTAKKTGSAMPAPLSSGSNQVKGVSYSAKPYPYSIPASPLPQKSTPINNTPIPYGILPKSTSTSSSRSPAGGSPSQGVVAPAPAQTTSKSLIERALAGEFGDFNRNLALAQQQRGADTKDTTIAVDNGTARDDEAKIRKDLAEKYQRAPLDLTYLNEAETFARDSLNAGEKGIDANFDRLRRQQEGEQKQETGELSTGLARAGGYLGFTGSGEAVMLSLTKSHRAELQDLESRRTQALSEARQAYNDQMYDVAREKQEIANEYEQQQYAEKQKYFDEVKKIQKEEQAVAEQERVNIDIFNALQTGAKDEMDVFGALKGKATPAQIQDFFKSIAPKTTDSDAFKPTSTQTAMLIGAGFAKDDIQTLYDHLNENGYDDVLKASLTPYQRRVMDDMLTMKPESVAGGSGATPEFKFTSTQKTKLVGAGFTFEDIANMQKDIAVYGIDSVMEGLDVDPTVFPGVGMQEDMVERITTDQDERIQEEGGKIRAKNALKDIFEMGGGGVESSYSGISLPPVEDISE